MSFIRTERLKNDLRRLNPTRLFLSIKRGCVSCVSCLKRHRREIAANIKHRTVDLLCLATMITFGVSITVVALFIAECLVNLFMIDSSQLSYFIQPGYAGLAALIMAVSGLMLRYVKFWE